MYSHPGRNLVASLERRFGRLAIPHLIRWIAIFQLAVWGLNLFVQSGGDDKSFLEYLYFDQAKVFSGEVWRLITFILIPRSANPLIILFVVFFMWFIGDGIEHEWGAFRVNLYVYATVLCLIVLGLIPGIGNLANIGTGFVFFAALFLAFASIYPDQIINLFAIIPVKAKWLAWADVAMLASMVIMMPLAILPIGATLLPYLIVFLPGIIDGMRRSSDAATRRAAFQTRMDENGAEAFHTCDRCGKTDVSDPELEFRVTSDGGEYCVNCLPAKPEETPAEG